jgi:hypothetical protein
VNTAAGKVELPIAIMEQGSDASNETKVLQSSLALAEELEGAIRLRLEAQPYSISSKNAAISIKGGNQGV